MQKGDTTTSRSGTNVTCEQSLRRHSLKLALMVTTALIAVTAFRAPALSQTRSSSAPTAARPSFDIPPQPLSQALVRFSSASGVQVFVNAGLLRGINSPGVSGALAPSAALSRLLSGTGLGYRFTNANTVAIERSGTAAVGGANVEGAIQLDTVDVSGGRVAAVEAPYQTPAPVAHISQETIDRFRGSSPADIFRGTPGVMSGEARNGAGSIDVNIRGMQGMGRVAVTVDGAENGLTVYQGYQGISNRTFVDPDLLAGVDITKGSDASSRGIAGTVAMRTLSASDVVKPGEKWGVWFKSGVGTNTTTPRPGDRGGYSWPIVYESAPHPRPVPTASASGLDRPGWLSPTSGSFSTVAAVKEEHYDLLWGYAYRKQGNYFAGKNGPGAQVIDTGPQPMCYPSGQCYYPPHPISYAHVYKNGGISSYRAGEQVLNTALETQSWIAKGTIRADNGHSLQVGYTGFQSEAGDPIASLLGNDQSQAVQQAQTGGTKLDTGTLRYRWKPDDNPLVDLKANLWLTNLALRTPARISANINVKPEDFGLPRDYRPGSDSKMWGGDLANTSRFFFDQFGALDLTYGMSYLSESTKPTPFTDRLTLIPARDGERQELAGFGKVAYKPVEWLTLNGGLRYSHYQSLDRANDPDRTDLLNRKPQREAGGYSPSAGVTVEPIKGTQFYVNYSNALRMPTLFESVSAFTLVANPDLRPERASNWDAGVNVIRDGVFAANDKAMVKFGYFNWNIADYVSRQYVLVQRPWGPQQNLTILNIDRAKFEGLEFSSRYENNGFTAELAANYYLNVEFCRSAGTCENKTLSVDYATNQIPPKYSANLTVSQKLLDDNLTIGSRLSYLGPRAAGHGKPEFGRSALIGLIDWRPYWLMDVFAEYKLSRDIAAWATIENLTDNYYVDPLGLVQQPGPGRTLRVGLTGKFGGDQSPSPVSLASLFAATNATRNWNGLYVGGHGGLSFADFTGAMTALDGSTAGYPAREAPDMRTKGTVLGLQGGFNYQFTNGFIAGLEADIASVQPGGSQITFATEGSTGNNGDNLGRFRQFEAVQRSEINWLSTVRGRLGYAFNNRLMVYATGGLALMNQDEERTQYIGQRAWAHPSAPVTTTVQSFTERASATRVGYAIGGGAEYALSNNWSLKGEYILARFDEQEFVFPNAKAGVMLPNNSNYPVTSDTTTGRRLLSKLDIPMMRFGVNYRF